MAKIVSPVWSSIRGSIAGTTYTTMPSGAIVGRQRVKPTQPVSLPRTYIKDGLAYAAALWLSIGKSARIAWDAWAAAHGNGLTGRQLFIGGQSFEYYHGVLPAPDWPSPIVNDTNPPTLGSLPVLTVVPALYVTTPGTGVAVSVTNRGAGKVIAVAEISAGFNPSRNYHKGPWDPTHIIAAEINAGAAATMPIGDDLTAGLKYFIRVRALGYGTTTGTTGRVLSVAWIVSQEAITNV